MILFDKLFNNIQFHYRKVSIGKNTKIIGRIELQGHGNVVIGNNVKIYSKWNKNPVGGGHGKTILQTIDNGSIEIGNNTGLSHATIVSRKNVKIGNNVLIGGGVQIFDNDFHAINYKERNDISKIGVANVFIDDNVFVGANCIILKGVEIGKGAVIGAGSVVTKNIPPMQIWAGNPAKYISNI